MKITRKIVQAQLILIALVWLLIFSAPLLFGDSDYGINWSRVLHIWKDYAVLLFIFLINHFVLMPQLFFKAKERLYFIVIVSLLFAVSSILFITEKRDIKPPPPKHIVLMGESHRPPPHRESPFIPPYANILIMAVLLIGFDSGLLFFSKWIESEQIKLRAEKESTEHKMSFLQNQISPHFFMNTLNNIHALVDISSEEAKAAIIKLSEMMDYMLYESQNREIALSQEIDFINGYVDLMRLRFTDDVKIICNFPQDIPPISVPPLLTISFIENAFKYGISYEEESFITITMEVKAGMLNFVIENTVHSRGSDSKHSGIGLENSRSRLELIYGDKQTLEIRDKSNIFSVRMAIPV